MNLIKGTFVCVIPLILLMATLGGLHYAKQKNIFGQQSIPEMTYDHYVMHKTSQWPNRFNFLEQTDFNTAQKSKFKAKDNYLQIQAGQNLFSVQYDAQVDGSLIDWVKEVRQKGDKKTYNSKYFVIQYDRFVEIVHFDVTKEVESKTFESEVCLEIPIQVNTNAKYHIDSHDNIWIVTASMNKVVFVQIYSCARKQLVNEFRYVLQNNQFVNQIYRIIGGQENCLIVQVVTYGLSIVDIKICPYSSKPTILETKHTKSVEIKYEQKKVKDDQWQVVENNIEVTVRQEWTRIIEYIINLFTFKSNSMLLVDKKSSPTQNQLQYFDSIVVDPDNHYLVTLSKNHSETGIKTLSKYMVDATTPLFHNNPKYDSSAILEVLDRQYKKQPNPLFEHKMIIPGLNYTKKMFYKAAYPTYPNNKIEHIGLAQGLVVFYPNQKLQQKDYHFIRTKVGGLVTQGSKFKGTYDQYPLKYEEIYHRPDAKPQEIMPGIYEVQAGYINLITHLQRSDNSNSFSRIQLLNGISGKNLFIHSFSTKAGYSYTSTMLLNNQWWILQYNPTLKQSMATKYELYLNRSNTAQFLHTKRVYGLVGSQQQLDGDDDLASLMRIFSEKHKKGYILLNIYRCIDEYYYIQYSDSEGNGYGIARIHFKAMSNRRTKRSKNYFSQFQRRLLLQQHQMLPQKISQQAYAVTLTKINLFKHVAQGTHQTTHNRTWYRHCNISTNFNMRRLERLSNFHYFPVHNYAVGSYGCDFNSDKPHDEIIYSFNMRNIITKAKIIQEQKIEMRKDIIIKIALCLPIYLIALAIFAMLRPSTKQNIQENVAEEQPATKGKKGKKD